MGIFSKLLGPKTPPRPPRDVAALFAPLAMPALQLLPGLPVRNATPAHSWFLGEPDLRHSSRPTYRGKPLGHLATIDLSQAQAKLTLDWLPSRGSLAFFYDLEEQPWGGPEHRGAWSVQFQNEQSNSQSPDSRPMSFRNLLTYPSYERPEVAILDLNEEEWEMFEILESAQTGGGYCHQLGGIQSLVQGDSLELESQFASHGLDFDEKTANSDRGLALSSGAADWRLLLQIASDDSLDLMWGDGGVLYFMIREADARAGRFDQVWLISECS